MITVVSGLPRSGTSLMMQLLAAGGLAPLTDGQRSADADNPRGYYELEKVKRLKEDSAWLADAGGKAIKVVSSLLFDLPAAYQYRVVFMTRALDETLASQQEMLARRCAPPGPADAEMRAHFERHLAKVRDFLARSAHLPTFWCSYNELLENPPVIVARIVAKWRRYHFLSDVDQRRLMIAMQYMRMSCNSTYLIDQETDHGTKADELVALLGDVLEDPTAKVVIFSQWVRTHELLRRRFERQPWGHVFFHGGVPGAKRKELVERFKQDSD
ncbi:SWF/SNF helicase family protein, partial [bacterium]|nr:SWF/SNF helicase family protein [bacterium]